MDFQLIKAMLDSRRNYTLFYERVPMDTIGTTTRALLGWIHAYYAANPTTQSLSIEQLKSYITIRLGDTVDTDGAKLLLSICDRVQHVQVEDTASIWNTLIEQDFAGRVGALYTRYDAGGEVALLDDVTELATEYRGLRIGNDTKPHDISEILQEIKDERGIKFDSIGILRDNVAALRGGKSIALAARPDKGKTSLLCQLATNIAPQCVDYFGVDRPILYLVNEGNERTIYPRMYQAALRKTMNDIYAMNDSGILIPEYEKVLNAPANYIQILPIHGFTIGQYRELVERLNPSFVITDMVEHVAIPNITSKPERITALWEQLRDLAIINDYIHMGTVQLGVEGGNCLFPTYEHINYSKTGIQAATDLILIMGALDGVEHQDLRGLSTPKNKQKVEGKPAYVETQMIFDMDRCYFNDGTGQVHTTTEITTESVMAQGGSHE